MSSTCGFSNFITKFVESYSISNILSEVTQASSTDKGHTINRFFYIGYLLIQFSSNRVIVEADNISADTTVTINFPRSFKDNNYSCIVCPYKQSNDNFPNVILIENSNSQRTNDSCKIQILTNGGNYYWIAIGMAGTPSSTSFSTFLSTYSINNISSNNLLSKGQIVNSLNTHNGLGHTQDGYIYIGNLLIQFSATPTILPEPNNASYNMFFPIIYATNPYLILVVGVSSKTNVVSERCILDTTASGYNNSFTLNDKFRVVADYTYSIPGGSNLNANGNVRWLSIGPAS